MKIRTGFVSNSSSTAYILDKRDPKVIELLSKIKGELEEYSTLGRHSCILQGQSLDEFVTELDDIWESDESYHANWIKEHKKELKENLVYLRISDEDHGGNIVFSFDSENNKMLEELKLDEQEYN